MQDFHEWLENQDPKTLEEIFRQLKDRFFSPSKARPFNDEERRQLAAIQKKQNKQKSNNNHQLQIKKKTVRQKPNQEIDWIG